MPSMVSFVTMTLLLAVSIHAHFIVQHPPTVGPFNDDDEGKTPCGGYNPDIDNVNITDFHVDGDVISTRLTHPWSTWLYRITLDPHAEGDWTEVYPIANQSGKGFYCIPDVTIPHEFIGKKGFLGIISHAMDGFLYQCSGVHFVEGRGGVPDDCKNISTESTEPTTGVYADDPLLSEQLNPHPQADDPAHVANVAVSGKTEVFRAFSSIFVVSSLIVLGTILVV
ncbi:hypothetical protein F5Y04DRAFT_290166 [Hypomontagnella monticulosa]|nr:hypothetical protein F5Y04DRAFT_290166 [Hypomontagnella monticulosa]